MALWDKVKQGIDKAGKAAQEALDEGKLRIDAYRAREQADKAAEALGYAVFRALEGGRELDTESRDRLMTALRSREVEAKRLEAALAEAKARSADAAGDGTASGASGTPGSEPAPDSPPPASPSAS